MKCCVHACAHTSHRYEGVYVEPSSPSTFLWALGMELRSPGLQGRAFTHGAKHGGGTHQADGGRQDNKERKLQSWHELHRQSNLNKLPCLSKDKTKPLRCAHFADKCLQQTLDLSLSTGCRRPDKKLIPASVAAGPGPPIRTYQDHFSTF